MRKPRTPEQKLADLERLKNWIRAVPGRAIQTNRAWREKNRAVINAKKHTYYEANKAKWKLYKSRISKERNRAKDAVNYAIEAGKMRRPTTCSKCGKPCKPHGHHHQGYSKENQLNVVWLCQSCHGYAHSPHPSPLGKIQLES